MQAATKVGLDGVVSVARCSSSGRASRPKPDRRTITGPSRGELRRTPASTRRPTSRTAEAPKLKGSNFEKLKKLNVLDAKTHNFTDAWNAGYDGTGSTVGVLDGGTDFGHPDLIGTWQTWQGAKDTDTTDDGWNGWPKAFDPYGTLQILLAPEHVTGGLSWYTPTTPSAARA